MKLKNPYIFFERFCLRTPLLPLDFYYDLTAEKEITPEKIGKIWDDKSISEALFLASPGLCEAVGKWLNGLEKDPKKIQRLQFSLLKYLFRMSSRCTPFGLFAGCSIGQFGETTHIELAPYTENKRQTRFDMNFLVALSQKLSKEKTIKTQLLWYPNTSLYRIGNYYRYIEYAYDAHNNRQHSIEAVLYTPYLETILKHARSGKRTTELAALLTGDDITSEEAERFIEMLIQNQLLVSELEPSISGPDFLEQLQQRLKKLQGTEAVNEQTRLFREFIIKTDRRLGNDPEDYKTLSESIKKTETPFELKYLFQADMYPQPLKNMLNKSWAYKIKRAMVFLNKISPPPQYSRLRQFKQAFTKRYETREMPLTTVLDTETGIGYLQEQEAVDSMPFLDDLSMPRRSGSQQQVSWSPVQDILYKKLEEAISTSAYTLELNDEDFQQQPDWNDLPDTLSAMVEIVILNKEKKAVLSHLGGSSAANLLGRFSTGTPELLEHVRDIVSTEKKMHPHKIMAEIIHLPQSRTGNVIRRASLREYEIPYLGRSAMPARQQIPIDDLMISVKNNKIVLRSVKHNKEVLPRLTNAHNYSGGNSLPIYHFLCDMQTQDMRSGIGFRWGELHEKNSFLPRVLYKDFILSKARWKITKKDIMPLLEKDPRDRVVALTSWRALRKMPRFVQLTDSDNTLLIDMEHYNSVSMWLNTVKNRDVFILREFLFTEESIVKQAGKRYTHQFVISFYNKEKLKTIA